jgi:alkylation response protein AidB-like acyl-CoA dehydrogenase
VDLTPTPEQDALRAAARDFLADTVSLERVGELADGEPGWDPAVWPALAELGWLGLSVPEEAGGTGAGLAEEAIVFAEAAAALLPSPLFGTVALALPAVAAAAEPALTGDVIDGRRRLTLAWAERGGPVRLADAAAARLPATRAGGGPSGWLLSGMKSWVPDLSWAQSAVVVAATPDGPGLFLVDLTDHGVTVTPRATVDTTRRLADLTLDGTPARLLTAGRRAAEVLAETRRRALVLGAAEAVGIASRMLTVARDHASTRQQFGRVIGTYQAVSHRIADLYTSAELARSLLIWAAWTVDHADPDAALAVSAVAAKAAPVAVAASETAIQVLGGIGMTWDAGIHRYYKRAMALEVLDGPPSVHRAALAAALLAPHDVSARDVSHRNVGASLSI